MRTEDLTAGDLVAAAMEVLAAPNASKLADALGMVKRNEDRRVRRWIDGLNEPNYEATMRLLVEVGLLPRELPKRAAGKPWQLSATQGSRREISRDDVAAALEELADLQERQDAVLERLLGHAVEQAPPRGGRRKRAG